MGPDDNFKKGGAMRSVKSVSSVVCILLLVCSAAYSADPDDGVPSLSLSTAEMAHQGPETLILLMVPDGSGPGFSQASTPSGGYGNATITLRLADEMNFAIAQFPAEDIWIRPSDNSLPFCGIFFPWPDNQTGVDGLTHWTQPLRGGGSHGGPIHVYVNGNPLEQPGLNLSINSPDIDGDLTVSLGDVVFFAQDFFGSYDFRSDLFADGAINLSDVGPLAKYIGSSCF
jgi:hypothetical protein